MNLGDVVLALIRLVNDEYVFLQLKQTRQKKTRSKPSIMNRVDRIANWFAYEVPTRLNLIISLPLAPQFSATGYRLNS